MDFPTLLPALIGTLLICVSIPLFTHPVEFSKHHVTIESTQAAFYARQLGIRNLMLGTALTALSYKGQIQGAAIVLCCFPILAVLDPFAGYMYRGRFVGNDFTHAVVGCVFGGVGAWILRGL